MSESELLQASLAGSREAFGSLVQRYQSLVCAITYSATGDIGRSEELAQETFLRGWKNLGQLENLNNFRAWLCTIARNLVSQSIRSRSGDVLHAADPLERAEVVAADAPDPGRAVMDRELQEIVWAAVGQVPQKYREPLVLFYRQQQSVSEVAADLDLSEDVVRQRLHRGRQLIKAEVSSVVEDTLARSGPSKAFAVAVVAALPALVTSPASAAIAGVVAKSVPAAKTVVPGSLAGVSLTAVMGWVGALLGPVLSLLAGALGCWRSIQNTKSPRERRFMIRMMILIWILVIALIGTPLALTLIHAIPKWAFSFCVWGFFAVFVPLSHWINSRQRRIQDDDGTWQPPLVALRPITRASMHACFAGVIFGPTSWLIFLAGIMHGWVASLAIIGCDIVLFTVVTRMYLRPPERIWTGVLVVVSGLTVMTLTVVNLCWNDWMAVYRQSSLYDPTNDISLKSINLFVVAGYLAIGLPLWYVCRKERRQIR